MKSTECARGNRDRVRRRRARRGGVSSWLVALACLGLASCGSSSPEPTVPEAPEVLPTDPLSTPEVDPTPEAPVVDPAAVAELPSAVESDEAPALPAEPSPATPPPVPSAKPEAAAPAKPVTPAKPSASKPSANKASDAPAATYSGDQPCKTTSFKVKAVEKACNEGGRSAAKDLMKKVVDKAKAGGVSLKCTSCHVDQKTYALQPNAIADLQRWL